MTVRHADTKGTTMSELALRMWVWQLTARAAFTARVRDERGEGVVSAAIAVLIMAFLGVLVWQGLRATLFSAQSNVNDQVGQIGR